MDGDVFALRLYQLVSEARQSFKNAQHLAAIIEHHIYFDYLCYQT